MSDGHVSRFLRHHFRHFNAATLMDAADAYRRHVDEGGVMLVAMAGAMSTAELGVSLAEMIRQDKVHAVCCTGANLEEDIFNLIAHDQYVAVKDYQDLSPEAEADLLKRGLNRVTDVCIPETVMRHLDTLLTQEWRTEDKAGRAHFHHQYLYKLLREGRLKDQYQIPPRDSWVLAAMEKDLPIFVPGWADSTLGNMFAAQCLSGQIKNPHTVRTDIEYLMELARWYEGQAREQSVGFFQIGGGIAGDFAICVVPLLRQDLKRTDLPLWGYFCQIGDSTTSYGSYSGAVPNEKITWGKLGEDTPRFMIESDATIVAPLIWALVMGE